MMKEIKIMDDDGKGYYTIFDSVDFEHANPIEYYAESFKRPRISIERDFILAKEPPFPIEMLEEAFKKRASDAWDKEYAKILATEVPASFIALLKATSKNEQVKLLNGAKLTTDQLIAFIFKAYTDFGLTFSQYTAEHLHKGANEAAMPKVIHAKDGVVASVGSSTLSTGQKKQVIDQRTVIVSKFFDKDKEWHCLFLTYRSLKGEENWKDGQPHFHYISDKFGITREEAVKQLKSKDYKLGNLPHIELTDWMPPKKS